MKKQIEKRWQRVKKRPLLHHALLAVGVLVAAGVIVHLLLLFGTRHYAERQVPEFTGLPLEEAQRTARKADLDLIVNDSLYVPVYEGGVVLDQLPEAGMEVKPGRAVYVTINSFAQRMVPVPYVAGRTLRQAKNMLEVAGLGIKELIYVPDLATHYVLEQRVGTKKVQRGSKLTMRQGSGVTLVVGENGYVTSTLPSIIGRSLGEAQGRLWEQGFNVGKIAFDAGITLLNQKDARVYLQTPAAGTRAHVGTKVDLRLTLDPEKAAHRAGASDRAYLQAAEESDRLEAARADSIARARLDSLSMVTGLEPLDTEDPQEFFQ